MSVTIKSVEQAIATAAHEVVVGAKAVGAFLTKANVVIQKDAPTVEALTSLLDPRAALIERIGTALLGQAIPAVQAVTGEVATDAQAPSVSLTVELFNDIKSLASSLSGEIATAKASIKAAA